MEGKSIIFSAPSGAGKTTIVRHLLNQDHLCLAFSISATTRAPRQHEIDGTDYHFMSEERFLELIDEEAFVEWEEVYPGQFYGTLKREMQRIWESGNHAIFDVDVVGGLDLKEYFEDRALAVFVAPPDLAVLEHRLRRRASESEQKISARIEKAAYEIGFADRFDVRLENNDLQVALKQAEELVTDFLKP